VHGQEQEHLISSFTSDLAGLPQLIIAHVSTTKGLLLYLTLFPGIIMVVGSSYTKTAAPAAGFGHTIIVSSPNPVNCFINSILQ
jgi:hypothetical protein